ncbi:MAG: hypothetical protein IPM84_26115 [Anaerolineae bacterium]|nr:hypothetical protein [Anaerolineae bacterium]
MDWRDPNGNATRRIDGGQDITLTYDAENRLTGMSGGATASYVYDGGWGARQETSGSSTTTVYVGNYYERLRTWRTSTTGRRRAGRQAAGRGR